MVAVGINITRLPELVCKHVTSVPLSGTAKGAANWQRRWFITPIRLVSFWTAVVLPFLYIPLVVAGLDSTSDISGLAVLVALNLVALLLGHNYNPR